jgi:hypothetical protein
MAARDDAKSSGLMMPAKAMKPQVIQAFDAGEPLDLGRNF